jgi:hypothetical protein
MVIKLQYSLDDFFATPDRCLRLVGLSLFKSEPAHTAREKLKKLSNLCLFRLCLFNSTLAIILISVRRAIYLIHDDKPDIVKIRVFSIILSFLQVLAVCTRQNEIRCLIKEFREVFKDAMIKREKCLDLIRFTRIYAVSKIFLAIGVALSAILSTYLKGFDFITAQMWLPNDGGVYFMLFVCFWFISFVYMTILMVFASEVTLISLIQLTSLVFDHLSSEIATLNIAKVNERTSKLKEIVAVHQKVFDICSKLEKLILPSLFLHFLQSSSEFVSTVLYIISTKHLFNIIFFVPHLSSQMFQVLLVCLFGQKVIDSSLQVQHAIYHLFDWFESRDKQTLLLIMLRSQKERKIKAIGFNLISKETFTKVKWRCLIKTSV